LAKAESKLKSGIIVDGNKNARETMLTDDLVELSNTWSALNS